MLWGWLLLVLAVLVAASAVTMAGLHARRIGRGMHADPARTASWLRSLPPEKRVARLRERAGDTSWEGRLCEELESAPSESARVAAVNSALGDAAHELDATSRLPFVAVRMSAWSALLLAIAAYLVGARPVTGWIFVAGVAGALAAWILGRRARGRADAQRRGLDELVHVLTGGRGRPGGSVQAERTRSRRRRT